MAAQYILVVDDEPDIRQLIREILEDEGYEVAVAEDAEQAKELRLLRRPDLVLLDIWMPGEDGISLLKGWKKSGSLCCPVIMMSGHGTIETAVEATRLGAYDFIEKPLSMAKMLLTIENALRSELLIQENKGLREQIQAPEYPLGSSQVMANLRQQAKRLVSQNDLILIYGESGVGKEVFARFIHANSENNNRNFVKATVSSFEQDLVAKKLFGFEEEEKVHYGLLDEANSGCLYLSDIAALPLDVQLKLLSALREEFYTRVGGVEHIGLSLTLIASSQHDLRDDVEAGLFDAELYAVLNIVPLMIPGLREHPEDVPELLNYYVDKLTEQDNLPYRHFSVAAQNYLRNYPWFGNIRELRNLVQRLLIMGTDVEITEQEVEESLGMEVTVFSQPLTETPAHLFELSLRVLNVLRHIDYL